MELSFNNSELENISWQVNCRAKLPPTVVAAFRKKLQMLLAAPSKSSFKNLKSMQILPLKGSRAKTHFVDLIDGWNLILSFQSQDQVKIIDINKN